jgi:hypothetical protein
MGDGFQALRAGIGPHGFIAGRIQGRAQESMNLRLVIDHQDPWAMGA